MYRIIVNTERKSKYDKSLYVITAYLGELEKDIIDYYNKKKEQRQLKRNELCTIQSSF